MTENTDADGGESLADKIRVSRRTVLSALGTGAGAVVLGSASTSNGGDQLSMGGLATNLTTQKRRDAYVTAPSSAFDPSKINENELFWVTDTGEIGVKGPNGTEHPGIGSASQPVPAVQTDRVTINKPLIYRKDKDGIHPYDPADYADGGAALQQAIDDVPTDADGKTHGIIEYYGILETSQTITVTTDDKTAYHIRGLMAGVEEGFGGSYIDSKITDGSRVFEVVSSMTPAKSDATRLENVVVRGNGSEGTGIYVEGIQDIGGVYDCGAKNVGGVGLSFFDCSEVTLQGQAHVCDSHGVVAESCLHADLQVSGENCVGKQIFLKGCSYSTLSRWEADPASNSAEGLRVYQGKGTTIRDGIATNAEPWGITLDDCQQTTVEGVECRGNGKGALVALSGSQGAADLTIKNSRLDEGTVASMELKAAINGVTVTNIDYNGAATKALINADAHNIDFPDEPAINGEVSVSPSSATYTASFDGDMGSEPKIFAQPSDTYITGYSYNDSDADGFYESVDISFAAVPTNLTWEARPRV